MTAVPGDLWPIQCDIRGCVGTAKCRFRTTDGEIVALCSKHSTIAASAEEAQP